MKTIFMFLFVVTSLFPQNISTKRIETIVKLLVSNSQEISEFIFKEEFEISNRFGINYTGVNNKFFIANDFSGFDENSKYLYNLKQLTKNYTLLNITIPEKNISRDFYLKDSFLISKSYCFTKDWKIKESNHFRFFISDESLFNDYSINELEKFITEMFAVLKFNQQQQNLIKQKKIFYFLCRNESEIKEVTGFTTRGMFVLAQDYIITIYNTHYHELVHFLINYKLKDLPLYTHPFLQEGLAVAFGGRGGLDVNTIFNTGVFMIKSSFADYTELLSRKEFLNTDASISYPVSGLYVSFLIKQIGIEKFIDLYKKYSSGSELKLTDNIEISDLPSVDNWNMFVDSVSNENSIKFFAVNLNDLTPMIKEKDYEIYNTNDYYFFRMKDTLLIPSPKQFLNYQSKLYKEFFPDKNYSSEKYLIIANSNEISIYNLFTNNLMGKYVSSFTIPPQPVKQENGFYEFYVNKLMFDLINF